MAASSSGSGGDLFGVETGPEEDADGDFAPAFPQPQRRAGRPAGAPNRKTVAVRRLYEARGFRDPVMGMGELVTSDPVALWKWMRAETIEATGSAEGAPTLLEVVKLQQVARADLAPYLHGKAPVTNDAGDQVLPMLIIDMTTDQVTAAQHVRRGEQAISIGQPIDEAEIVENQGVSGDAD